MTRINNLAQDPQRRANTRLDRLERGTQLGNASITLGKLRIAGLDAFLLQGSGRVTGTLYIDGPGGGVLDVTGRMNATGTIYVDGGGRIVISEAGDLDHSMQMLHEGGVARVVAFGVPMELTAWSSSVSLEETQAAVRHGDSGLLVRDDFVQMITSNGAHVTVTPDSISIYQGAAHVLVNPDEIEVSSGGGPFIRLTHEGMYLVGLPTS